MPQPHYVYLSGPIAHTTFAHANRWREEVRTQFLPGIIAINPLPDKDVLSELGLLDGTHNDKFSDQPFYRDQELLARDHHDVINAHALMVNLLGTEKVSIGTVAEIAWAFDRNIKVCLVMEDKDNPHDHPFIRGMCHFRTGTLEGGVRIINSLLAPYLAHAA